MVRNHRMRLLAAGVSGLAVGAGFTTPAAAAPVEGVRQDAAGTIAVNLYEVLDTDPAQSFGIVTEVSNPGGAATATAMILCAELATCTAPGAIEQVASGVDQARNDFVIGGAQEVHAIASAEGATASAIAFIDTAILQLAISSGSATNAFEVSGALDVLASAHALGTDGPARAFAGISQAVLVSAVGATGAVVDMVNVGAITLHATANASAQGGTGDSAHATALVYGINAFAGVTGAGDAAVNVTNDGVIAVAADANAISSGPALAFAYAIYGIGASAAAASGDAAISVINNGQLTLSAEADASGLHAATASAVAAGGIAAVANGFGAGDVSAEIVNTGSVLVEAGAHAVATTNALAIAIGVTGFYDIAHAMTGDAFAGVDNSGTLEVTAHATATALVAQATAVVGGALFAGGIFQSAAAANGNALAMLDNKGDVLVAADANAHGSVIAYAIAYGGPGVNQLVFATGGDAVAEMNNSGSILLSADALASATNSAFATALYFNAFNNAAFAGTGADALLEINNSGTVEVAVNATAIAGGVVSAHASATHVIGQVAFAFGGGDVVAGLDNSGALAIDVNAVAAGSSAWASATVVQGLYQTAIAIFGGDAAVELNNSGTIAIGADADGGSLAQAFVLNGVMQVASAIAQTTPAFAVGNASAVLTNQGTIEIGVHAAAADSSSANAAATISGGIFQVAAAGAGAPTGATAPEVDAVAVLANSGDISLAAAAEASGSSAVALANIVGGISQIADAVVGDANAAIANEGSIVIDASAAAAGGPFARANAVVYGGFFQSVEATTGDAVALFDNEGVYDVGAQAQASGDAIVVAYAQAFGGGQQGLANGTGTAAVALVNDGDYAVHATAQATASPTTTGTGIVFANAGAQATGLFQFSNNGSASFSNSGSFDVGALALANGGPQADGFAVALGVNQSLAGTDAAVSFANSGDFNVEAGLDAQGEGGFGFVLASGYRATGSALAADVDNSGDMSVIALGVAPEGVRAGAVGIALQAAVATTATAAALLGGTLDNSGNLTVIAFASGGLVTTGTGTTATEVPGSAAFATGIALTSGVNTMTVNNSGALIVDAVTVGGGEAAAYGIKVEGNGTGALPGADDVLTLNNSGDILVRVSSDGGESFQRGMAIDVSAAPNPSVINLLEGSIYGNIALQDGDAVNVAQGTTYFDGVINPGFLPVGGVSEDTLDSGLFGVGSLTISGGGNLVLADPRVTGDPATYDGPAYALVETFTVGADGTITYELQPTAGGIQPPASYPQVFADVASLDGTLVAVVTPPGGLFDSYFWDNVIDANVRSGQFDQCVLAGPYTNSVLLDFSGCIYDGAANVDLALERVAFDAVPGLNRNGRSVGFGLECIYSTSLTGGIADLLADLFLFTDPVNYNTALNMLAGEGYANYLQSFPSLGVHHNDLIDRATNCEVPALAGSILECRASSPIHLWGQLDYQWRKADGDSEAGTMRARRFTGLIGADATVANSMIVGISAGYVTNNTRTRRFNEKVDGDGFQVGLYGAYDPGQFYVKAVATHSWYSGDSSRRIDFTGLAPGASFSGTTSGEPDVRMWTFGLHGGYRIGMGDNSVLTPYLNYDYVNAKLKGFTETGLEGANLNVLGGSAKHSFLTAGVKWATQFGGVVPEVNLGYRHRFGEKRSNFTAQFIDGSDATDCRFDIISAGQKRGTFLAGVSVGGKMGPVDLRIGYEGEFNSDITSHAANFKIVLPLGGRAAPPPPPPPAPVVAPPPPPPVEVAPPPPPPPPAPVERGERG